MARLTGYVAFNPLDAREVETQGELNIEMFAPCRYISIRNSPAAAIKSALDGMTVHCVASATEETDWIVLELVMNAIMVGTLFIGDHLIKARDYKGWRCTTSIKLAEVESTWFKCKIHALGLVRWAELTLHVKRQFNSTTGCAKCNSSGCPLWTSSKNSGNLDYCSQCWQMFFLEAGRQSIFDRIG
jgi:hypothetical protein